VATQGVKLPITEAEITAAIIKCKGRLTNACRELGICYETIRKHTDNKPHLVKLIADLRKDYTESMTDKAEDCLSDAMDNRKADMTNALKASMFFLNNHGRNRGYNPPVINQQGDIKITPQQLNEVKAMLSDRPESNDTPAKD